MAKTLAGLVSDAREWLGRARDAGWLDDAPAEQLDTIELASPAALFSEPAARPLVVALFGGTGVGKSSLLNRVAGEALARTGVERPTSHEVTLFLHESITLADLPSELPVDSVRVARHSSAAFRAVAWLDMPDIDSVAEANRATALAWLPFVDLVCYVVSPERYRDDRGWRVLLDRRQRHGWLFIMNRWDEGHAEQPADFIRLIRSAGFEQPTLVRTCCRAADRGQPPPLPSPDEFDTITTTVRSLAAANVASQLSIVAEHARIRDVRGVLSAALPAFGEAAVWTRAAAAVQQRWDESSRTIATGLEYSIRAAAARFSDRDGLAWRDALAAAIGGPAKRAEPVRESAPGDAAALAPSVWDDWAGGKLAACFDAIEVDAARLGLAPRPLRAALDTALPGADRLVGEHASDALRAALAQPGTALVRAVRRLTGFLTTFLPFMALLWIAFGVVRGFYAGVHEGRPFLGTAFAINSALMLAVAWAAPFAFDRWLRPSLRESAERGLRSGVALGLAAMGESLQSVAAKVEADARTRREAGERLIRACDERLATPIAPEATALVARVA